MTWADLIADVRAQIDTTADQAYRWLLDRARVMNAETDFLVAEATLAGVDAQQEYSLPTDWVKVEAVVVNGTPYRRSTFAGMDAARCAASSRPIYSDAVGAPPVLAIWPPPSTGAAIVIRYVQDVPDNRAGSPPFPADFHSALADGAIATGLARADERFDSAGYFEARFNDAIQRLRRRRHSRVGRGGVPIRLSA